MDSERPAREDRPVTFLAAAGWTILLKLLFEIALGVIEGVHPGAVTDIVTITASRVLALSITLFVLLRVHDPEGSVRRFIAFRRPPIGVLLLSAVTGAALAVPASWISTFVTEHLPKSDDKNELLETLFSADTTTKKVILLATVVVVIPACDELFFRGALFTPLKRDRRADVVILATAAYDALLNLNPRGMLVLLVLLVVLGWLRGVSGSVVPAIVARVAFFAALLGPGLLGKPDLPTRPLWIGGALGAAAVALAAVGAICKRSELAAEAREEDG